MSKAYHRKKQPEAVRQQLLEVAAKLSLEKGPGSVTLDAVSQAAGVSKGGLLHHFPNKLSLMDGLFDDLTAKFDRALAERMTADPEPHGRFTRAYLSACFDAQDEQERDGWMVLTTALLSEPHLRERMRRWTEDRLTRHVGTDSSPDAVLARCAIDGLWLADLLGAPVLEPMQRQALREKLIALTHS